VVDIGVASNQDNVATVPTQLRHFSAAHGQKRSRAKTRRPELAIAVQGLGVAREKRDVDQCVHGAKLGNGVV